MTLDRTSGTRGRVGRWPSRAAGVAMHVSLTDNGSNGRGDGLAKVEGHPVRGNPQLHLG